MRKALFLLGLAMVIVWNGCKKEEPKPEKLTCSITSPQNGAGFSNANVVVVSVDVKNADEATIVVTLFVDEVSCDTATTAPYNFTIPVKLLTIGTHTIKAVAVDKKAVEATSSIAITILESEDESPNFVTFDNGEIPKSWKTVSWIVDNATGYDDDYSLKSNGDNAAVLTRKTYTTHGCIEFYTKGDNYVFSIDGEISTPVSSSPAGSWKRMGYDFPAGTHTFRWETTSTSTVHLDAITFSTPTLPEITTNPTVTKITPTKATLEGTIISNGNSLITECGICWSTSENPTIEHNKTVNESCTENFTTLCTGLAVNTLYYARAYATNGVGTAYGEQVSFKTLLAYLPEVTTQSITNITVSSAECGGIVKSDGNNPVTQRGVCWNTSENPTIENDKTINGSGTGNFTSNLTNLLDNTSYYVRAYATNDVGTAYGEQITFTTERILVPGEAYQGGIIAYVDNTGRHGFIIHEETKLFVWSESFIETGANETSIGSGMRNTEKMVNVHGNDAPGAYYCRNLNTGGYTDWFLPSFDELKMIYQNRNIIGGFHVDYYWCSTELNQINAISVNFQNGVTSYVSKDNKRYVRAIRYF